MKYQAVSLQLCFQTLTAANSNTVIQNLHMRNTVQTRLGAYTMEACNLSDKQKSLFFKDFKDAIMPIK